MNATITFEEDADDVAGVAAPVPLDPLAPIPAQLKIAIDTQGVANTIYVSSNPADNAIVLEIGTTVAATFTPAPTIPDESGAAKATGSLLYLDLKPLAMTAAQFAAITPAPVGWSFVLFPADQLIGLSPKAAVTLQPGDTIPLAIGALACPLAQGASASLSVTAFRVTGVTVGALPFPTSFSVALATPPSGGDDLTQDLLISLATPQVVTSVDGYDPVSNQLAFAFTPGPRGRPVKAGPSSQFSLSFVYANDPSGYGALCTTDEVQPPFAVVPGVGAGAWKVTPHRTQQSPSWTIQPPAGKSVVTQTNPVAILANDLVTTFQPGPTLALISYSGFDGYAPGVVALPIQKVGHVRIDELTVRPNPSVLKDGAAEITVSWKVANAGTMTLQPFDKDVTGKTSYAGPITDSALISLTADGLALANAGNIAIRNTTASVLPVINSFDATPRALYAGDLPRSVTLGWNVDTNGQVQLTSSTDGPDPTLYAAAGQIGKTVDGPQMFTLVPQGQKDTNEQRSIVVSAFTPTTTTRSLAAAALAAPPDGSYVVIADGRSTVTAVDTMVFAPVSTGVPSGAGPVDLVFSADGGRLYIANSVDQTVSVVSVAPTGAVPQYAFTTEATIAVDGPPQRLALSPDGAYLYVSVDGGTRNGQLVVIATATGTVVSRLNVGVSPRGIGVLRSGAQLFVANAGSSTVTIIGRSPGGHHNVVGQITGLATAQDVAATPDGKLLFVTCPSAGAVIAINATTPDAPRASLPVGDSPQRLSILPGGGYVAVACAGAGAVALVAAGTTPAGCSVVDASLATLAGASAVTVSPDGGLLLAGAGSGGMAVVQLAEYQATTNAPSVGGQPTDVRFASDGRSAYTWHNARRTFSPGTPSTGLSVYDTASGTATPRLADVAIVDLAPAPVAAKTVFVVAKTPAAVQVVATDTWTTAKTIDLSGATTGTPVALRATPDAAKLFVLAQGAKGVDLIVLGSSSGVGTKGSYAVLGTVTVTGPTVAGSSQTLAIAPDGSAAYVTDAVNSELYVVARDKTGTYALSGTPIDIGMLPIASDISPDGSELFVACVGVSTNGSLARYDTATKAVTSVTLPPNAQTELKGLAVSPDGTRLFATDGVATGVRVFDAASLRLVQTIGLATGAALPMGIAVSPDASLLLNANTRSGTLGVAAQVQADAARLSAVKRPTMIVPEPSRRIPVGVGDDPYSGFFVRDYLGQTPTSGRQGTTDSPDIWPSGQAPLANPQDLVTNYLTAGSPNTIYTAAGGATNWIYVRGENDTTAALETRVWVYYINGGGSPTMILWPPLWSNSGITTEKTQNTWSPVTIANPGDVGFTTDPFLWSSVPVNGHYCVVAWADNQPLSTPPVDPRQTIGSLGTMDDLAAFIANHPNFGWKNTTEQPTPKGSSFDMVLPLTGPKQGGLFLAGLQFYGMPAPKDPSNPDYYFSYRLDGPTITPPRRIPSTANVPKTPITSPNENYTVPLDWTGSNSYQTNMVISIWSPNGALPQGATFDVTTGSYSTSLVGRVRDPLSGASLANVYPTQRREDGFHQVWTTRVGQVQVTPPTS